MDTATAITILVLGLAFIANIVLGGSVLFQNPKRWLNRYFFAFTLSASAWVLTNLLYATIHDTFVQFVLALLSYAAAGLLAMFFLLYCMELARRRSRRRSSPAIVTVGVTMTVASVIPGFIATDVTPDARILTNFIPLAIYGLYLFVFMGSGIVLLLRGRARAHGIERDRITIVLLGLVFAAVFGLALNLLLPLTGNYDYVAIGPVASLILAGSSTYAIVRHRLFDVKLAAVRTVAYGGSLLTLAGVYYLLAYFISSVVMGRPMAANDTVMSYNVGLALLLAFLFQPIKRFFDKVTDNIFYHDNYRTGEFFAELNRLLVSTTDLRGLLERASTQIGDTFKAEQVFFFLYYSSAAKHHMAAGTPRHAKLPIYDVRMLDTHVAELEDGVLVTELLEEDNPTRRMLVSHKISLVVPLRMSDAIVGYVFLGQHRGGNYTKHDLEVLATISSELVIAVQNAISIHEVKELNTTLQQRIDVATKELRSSNAQLKHLDEVKDEFMSMASHQLRTPLTSIKGYLSMMIDGDVGKITPQQEKVLSEAFNSSERMVHLIADFLNVSRLQTGKFVIEKSVIDFNFLVEQEIEDLRVMAKGRGLELVLKLPSTKMLIDADASKLREVVTNFVDNAIYYSRPGTKVAIRVKQDGSSLLFTVTDTGIGVPKTEQARVFGKFFRATNARKQRPDGTGVGLYLARKVIMAHSGTVVFESVEGKGSIFGFRMPLVKLPDNTTK